MSIVATGEDLQYAKNFVDNILKRKFSEINFYEFLEYKYAMINDVTNHIAFMLDSKGKIITDKHDLLVEIGKRNNLINLSEDLRKSYLVTVPFSTIEFIELLLSDDKTKINAEEYAIVKTVTDKTFYLLDNTGKLVETENKYFESIDLYKDKDFVFCKSSLDRDSIVIVPRDKIECLKFVKKLD